MQAPKIVIASDHAGYSLKEGLKAHLAAQGRSVLDCGADGEAPAVDYPDNAVLLAREIARDKEAVGILICGSGVGMSIAANRYPFIRAALAWMPEIARLARRHNNANVLVLPGRFMDLKTAQACLDAFLETSFEGGRHEARLKKIERIADEPA